jgi:hypothetical protein
MRTYNEYSSGQSVAPFFGKLFAIRDNAHMLHLSSKSYSEHKALGSFYEGLTDLIDSLVEVYQGQYGLVTIEPSLSKEKTALSLLEKAADDFSSAHNLFDKKDSHIHNTLDEIVALAYKTLYKVKFLK